MSLDDAMKAKAAERFWYRKTHELNIVINDHVVTKDNSDLPAGAPMVYFCDQCGWPTAILDEQFFLSAVPLTCNECLGMQKRGWMVDALHNEGWKLVMLYQAGVIVLGEFLSRIMETATQENVARLMRAIPQGYLSCLWDRIDGDPADDDDEGWSKMRILMSNASDEDCQNCLRDIRRGVRVIRQYRKENP